MQTYIKKKDQTRCGVCASRSPWCWNQLRFGKNDQITHFVCAQALKTCSSNASHFIWVHNRKKQSVVVPFPSHGGKRETERVSSADRSRVLLQVNPLLQSGFLDKSPGSGLMHEERESGGTDWLLRIRAALINPDDVSTPPPTAARDRAVHITDLQVNDCNWCMCMR